MKDESYSFINIKDFHTESDNLKDLLKTVLALSQKQFVCRYISKHFSFEIPEVISLIRGQLEEIRDKIEKAFKNSREDSDRVQSLLAQLKICKFYNSVE